MSEISDEQLDAVLLGGREERAIVIVDYDPAWAERFDRLAQRIRDAVAASALAVEHIGSTAVPGLAAKPILDILLIVADVEQEDAYVAPLTAVGFVLRVREEGHRMLRTPARDVHVHVFAAGDPAIAAYLDLRDWLRVDAADRDLYAATKRELARRRWPDMNYYADAKSDVVAEILAHARQWRAEK